VDIMYTIYSLQGQFMNKILISIPIEEELYLCALEVENDSSLNDEINIWDVTISDGLNERG